MTLSLQALTRSDFEDFLIEEAALLDAWRLEDWRSLFTDDCQYLVPNPAGDPHAPLDASLYLIADDAHHLTERIKRLGKRTAHAEQPRSRTRRMVSNVRILSRAAHLVRVESGFVTFRASQSATDIYFGHHEHDFVLIDGALRIKLKRTILDMTALRPHGRLSIIV